MSIINELTIIELMDGFGPPPLPPLPVTGQKWSAQDKAQTLAAIGYMSVLHDRLLESVGKHELSKITLLCGWPTSELDALDKFVSRCANVASHSPAPLWLQKATGRV